MILIGGTVSAVLKLIATATAAISLFRWTFIASVTVVALRTTDTQRRRTAVAILRMVFSQKEPSADGPGT